MSGPFAAIDIARSGASVGSAWMNTIAHNLANVNTATTPGEDPFRSKYLHIAEAAGGGVHVVAARAAQGNAPVWFDPAHPLADEEGVVQGALVDVAGQMSDLVIASRHYQMNLRVVTAAQEAYQAALTIGQTS